MPRRPFLQVAKSAKSGMSYAIGPGQINSRPELASLVGQCIAMWTEIELQMGLSLGAILKTNSEAAVALFLAAKTLMTPLICQIGPKTSANSGCSCSVREKRCISGRNLASGIVGIRS